MKTMIWIALFAGWLCTSCTFQKSSYTFRMEVISAAPNVEFAVGDVHVNPASVTWSGANFRIDVKSDESELSISGIRRQAPPGKTSLLMGTSSSVVLFPMSYHFTGVMDEMGNVIGHFTVFGDHKQAGSGKWELRKTVK